MDIANFLNLDRKIPEDQEKLTKFLATLSSDKDWNLSNQKEAGYAAMGELRYQIDFSDTWKTKKDQDVEVEAVSASASGSGSSAGPLALGNKVQIKIESPEWMKLEGLIKILESAEPRLAKITQEMQKIKFEISACKNSEGFALSCFKHKTCCCLCCCCFCCCCCCCCCWFCVDV